MADSAIAPSRLTTHSSAPPPSAARLTELLGIAERRFLTPVEAADLRRGVEHLMACLAGAGAQLRRSIRDAERVRDEHARELLMERHPGVAVVCRRCGAPAGVWCRPVAGGAAAVTLHAVRLVDAGVLR
ncbi:hypothetical protein ACPC54_23880 [Kitasatospora sp. NPDC094028]